MNNKSGFSLLSFLLYLMLFSIIALFTIHSITGLLLPSLSATRICQSLVALHSASDLFVRDLRAMRNKPHTWKKITNDELVWHVDDHDVGWLCTEKRLERREGMYENGWKSQTTSLVACGITQGTFVIESHNNRIIGIKMTLIPEIAPKKEVLCYVASRFINKN